MKPEDFVRMVEQYYGQYDSSLMRATVLKYLQGLPAAVLQPLYKQLLLMHSSQFKAIPDIAILEKARREMQKNDNGVYRDGRRIGYYDGGRFIPDLSLLTGEQLIEYAAHYECYGYPAGFQNLLGEGRLPEEERRAITAEAGK